MIDEFTSTGAKFWHHPEALKGLREGTPRPVVAHIMPTDICQHTCAFCSVATRDGDVLKLEQITTFLDQLTPIGLKAVILSGGGNPILYPQFNELVDVIWRRNLQIGLITNGMPLKDYPDGRVSWKNVKPSTLDKLTWVRISMSGLDHKEREVYVPDISRTNTTLGFSYVYHDHYTTPEEPNHGKVSTQDDLIKLGLPRRIPDLAADDRYETLVRQIRTIVNTYNPRYVRLLPNCLEPDRIAERCDTLRRMAAEINPEVVFVQYKPPAPPSACYLGYLHPVLNTDGYVYPCDSCVLNKAADHKFAEPWRVARWDNVADLYAKPATSLVNPKKLCPGCVFTKSNELLTQIAHGQPLISPTPAEHPNFV